MGGERGVETSKWNGADVINLSENTLSVRVKN